MLTRRQYAGLLLVAGVTGLVGGGTSHLLFAGRAAQAQEGRKIADLVEAREFRVVDSRGLVRVRIGLADDDVGTPGRAFLALLNRESQVKVWISASGKQTTPPLGPGMPQGKPDSCGIMLEVDDQATAMIRLFGWSGLGHLELNSGKAVGPWIRTYGEFGKLLWDTRADLGVRMGTR